MSRSCQCDACQSLCRNEPGWFLPAEIGPAAAFLRLDRESFQARYLVEHREGAKTVLSPQFLARERRCIFFEKGLCSIHEVKPYECQKVFGCEAGRRHKRIREIIADQW